MRAKFCAYSAVVTDYGLLFIFIKECGFHGTGIYTALTANAFIFIKKYTAAFTRG